MPFRLPVLSEGEIESLGQMSFCAAMAQMVNLMFGTHVTAWDVECCVGRNPVRLTDLKRKVRILEQWHNPGGTVRWMVTALGKLLGKEETGERGSWLEIGVRMAALAATLSRWSRNGKKIGVSCVSGDFSQVLAAWYLREMGFPIGTVICACNENNAIWELFCHGQLRTGLMPIKTNTPDADVVVPDGLERLIFAAGGYAEVMGYLDALDRGGVYCPGEGTLQNLQKGMSVCVVSSHRIGDTIAGVYGTDAHILSPYGALAYAGLMDHRTKAGEICQGLLVVDKSPALDADTIAEALGINAEDLKNALY